MRSDTSNNSCSAQIIVLIEQNYQPEIEAISIKYPGLQLLSTAIDEQMGSVRHINLLWINCTRGILFQYRNEISGLPFVRDIKINIK